MSHSPIGWQLQKAHKEGFEEGYKAGTEDMRKAHGTQVATPRQEAFSKPEERDDGGLQRAVEESRRLREPQCLHDGQEDASDCPFAEGEVVHITVARFPPFR